MPISFFRVEVVNAEPVKLAFSGLAGKIGNFIPIWRSVIQGALKPWISKQFSTEGGAGLHGRWAALEPRYARRKAKQVGAKPILVYSGALRKAMLADANYVADRRSLSVLSGMGYGKFHQTGFRTRLGTGARRVGTLAFVSARRLVDPEETLRAAITLSITRGVAQYARSVGWAVLGRDARAAEAYQVGRARIEAGFG